MMTQITDVSPMCSDRWISGRARTTIVVSIAVIRTPTTTTSRARFGCCPRDGDPDRP